MAKRTTTATSSSSSIISGSRSPATTTRGSQSPAAVVHWPSASSSHDISCDHHCLTDPFLLMQSHGYRLIAFIIILFICMQFILNFSYHTSRLFHPLIDPHGSGAGLPFKYDRRNDPDANSFLLEDMEQQQQQSSSKEKSGGRYPAISRGYLSRTDYVYAASGSSQGSSDPAAAPSSMPIMSNNNHTSKAVITSQNSSQVQQQLNLLQQETAGSSPPPLPLKSCPAIPPALVGRVKVLLDPPSMSQLERLNPLIEPGGRFRPKECLSRHRVAIIIPYRDREDHLRAFLHNLHPILSRQQIDYGIFVIEEIPDVKFNRAKLMNIGFKEAISSYDYQCFIFHDVDLLPEDDRNLYTCPDQPRHMSVAVNEMNYRLPYRDIFGGVSALTKDQMITVNGFSNEFWGWGGEDDDMSNRVRFYKYRITRYRGEIARYHMLKHKKDPPNPDRYKKLYKGRQRFRTDGLTSLDYKVVKKELRKLYTWILVDPLYKKT